MVSILLGQAAVFASLARAEDIQNRKDKRKRVHVQLVLVESTLMRARHKIVVVFVSCALAGATQTRVKRRHLMKCANLAALGAILSLVVCMSIVQHVLEVVILTMWHRHL